jgi:hypothetical protein
MIPGTNRFPDDTKVYVTWTSTVERTVIFTYGTLRARLAGDRALFDGNGDLVLCRATGKFDQYTRHLAALIDETEPDLCDTISSVDIRVPFW